MNNIKESHDKYMAKLRASGVVLTEFNCPDCEALISTRVPDSDIYDTMSTCPECGEIFFKIVHANGEVKTIN